MKNKQKATIVSIDHLNKSFEVKITKSPETDYSDSYSYVQLLLPKDQVGNYFEVGDAIEFKNRDELDIKIVNLSCQILRLARFKRDLTSILRKLDSDNHPLSDAFY